MEDLYLPGLVRYGYLLHDIDYEAFDGNGRIGQVDSVELLQDLLEGVVERVVA